MPNNGCSALYGVNPKQKIPSNKLIIFTRLLPLQIDNFSKCVFRGTGYEFFLFHRKVMLRSQDIYLSFCIFNHPMI